VAVVPGFTEYAGLNVTVENPMLSPSASARCVWRERQRGGHVGSAGLRHRVYPASQLGAIPRHIEGTQFGAIQCALIPPEFFVGVDERFEVLAAPGLVDSVEHAHRLTLDPVLLKLILGLGADKGTSWRGAFLNGISSVIATKAIRHVSDFKGKKIRTLASKFQIEPFNRLGATPVVMTLGDVMPACRRTQTESHLL